MASASHSLSTEPAGRVPVFLGLRWLPAATIALALVLVSPSLGVGPMGDDYMQMARVDPRLHVPGFAYAPLDLFAFVSGDPAQRAVLREEGVFGWWMAPDFKLSFWRPLSSFTHVVDHWLWPRSSPLAHAQTLAWFAGLLVVIAALYRGLHAPWVAHLALALYALDDARGWVLGWTANRNVIVAAVFAFAALLAHDRARRRGWRPGVWLAPALYAMALQGGEAALAVTGYLLAHALFLDQGPLARRLLRLWPYAALSLAWLAVYRALGYGTIGGDAYVNPLDTPLLFLRVLAERLPILAAAQLGAGLSDAWAVLPPTAQLAGYALALLVLALFAVLIAPLWRRSPVCRFWTTGAVLSLPPVCATFPMDRLLVFAGVGAMGTVALVLSEWLRPALSLTRARRVATAAAAVLLIGFHLVLAPLLLPARVLLMGVLVSMGERLESSIPRDESIRERSLVILGSAAEMTTLPPWMQRQVQGVPRPRRFRLLANSYGALRVTRVDERTLRIRPQRGFLDNELLRMVRGVSRPFHPGDEVILSDMRVRVREALPDGRAAEADFRFGVPLEDASLLWMRLQAGGPLRPWAPPAVGETVTLASIEPHGATATSAASR
jgi:hypothetical protein